jgi:bud site selection protein 20
MRRWITEPPVIQFHGPCYSQAVLNPSKNQPRLLASHDLGCLPRLTGSHLTSLALPKRPADTHKFYLPTDAGRQRVTTAQSPSQHDSRHYRSDPVATYIGAMPAIRGANSKRKTRRHTRDLDQVHADVNSKRHLEQYHETKAPEDLPGFGQWYCIECAKWFESETNFVKHAKGKPHKRRVRQLKEEPYSQKEADAAVGLTTDNGRNAERDEMEVVVEVDEVK